MNQETERNFRFPVFSDTTGVKLPNELPDNFLAEGILTQTKSHTVKEETVQEIDEEKIEEAVDVVLDQKRTAHPSSSTSRLKSRTYEKNMFNQGTTSRKKREFSVRNERKETPRHSRFTPKYIPASLISDEKTPEISREEIKETLFKRPESYTLLDDGSFEEPKKEPKQIIPKSLVEKKEEEVSSEKTLEVNSTPKKRSALDKSLKGIFQEEQTPFFNRYFEE